MLEPGVSLFCSHHWERPLYNKELNLRQGLEKCNKCSSVRGYKRFVPLPDMEEEEYKNEYDYDSPNIGVRMLSIIIPLTISIIVIPKMLPLLTVQTTNISNQLSSSGSPGMASFVAFIPIAIPMLIIVGIVSSLMKSSGE